VEFSHLVHTKREDTGRTMKGRFLQELVQSFSVSASRNMNVL
jgi:hypothetical protein